MADGVYSLRVTATDSSGATVPSQVIAQGVVTGVQQVNGQTLVTLNGAQVPWEKITLIREAPKPVITSSNTTGGQAPPVPAA
jgi:flagellar basal-body rod modification protein FlgD